MSAGVDIKIYCIDVWGLKLCLPPIAVPTTEPGIHVPAVETVNEWISEQITNGIISLANGINQLNSALQDARGKLISGMVDAIKDPKTGGFALLGLFLTTMVLSIAWQALQSIAQVKAVTLVLEGISNTLASIARFLKLDLIITLARLGGLFNDEWHKALSELYVSMGAISQELETDFSFINVFAEVDRSILFTANSFTDNAWLKAQAGYAEGLTEWLGGLNDKLGDYVANPQHVFVDLQKAIVDKTTDEADKENSRVLAAVDKSTLWIEESGNRVIDEVDYLQQVIQELPKDLSDAILAHVQPYIDDFNYFVQNQWQPFFDQYHEAQGIIGDYLDAHGVRLSELEKNINSPLDVIDNLFLLTPGTAEKAADSLWGFITGNKEKALPPSDAPVNTAVIAAVSDTPPFSVPAPAAPRSPTVETVPRTPSETVPLPDATWYVGEDMGASFPAGAFPSNGSTWYQGE